MVTLTIQMRVKPTKRKQLLETVLSLLRKTRGEEGCAGVSLEQDFTDAEVYLLQSKWETQDDLNVHLLDKTFSALCGAMHLLQGPPRFGCREVADYTHLAPRGAAGYLRRVARF